MPLTVYPNHRVRRVSIADIREALQALQDLDVDVDDIPLDKTVRELIVMANTATREAQFGVHVNLRELLNG